MLRGRMVDAGNVEVFVLSVAVLGPGYRLTGLGLWGSAAVNWLYLAAICYSVAVDGAEASQAARSWRHHGLTIAEADKRSIDRSLRSLLFDSLAA